MLVDQGCRTTIVEGRDPSPDGVWIPLQCLRPDRIGPALSKQPNGVLAFPLPGRGSQNHPSVHILGIDIPSIEILLLPSHTYHQPLASPDRVSRP